MALAGDKEYLVSPCGRAFVMFAQKGNSLVAVSDPVGDPSSWPALIDAFAKEARAFNLRPEPVPHGLVQSMKNTNGGEINPWENVTT